VGCVINLTQVYLCAIAETFITQFEGVIGRKATGGCHRSCFLWRFLDLSSRLQLDLNQLRLSPPTTDSRYGICVAYFAYRYAVCLLELQLRSSWLAKPSLELAKIGWSPG